MILPKAVADAILKRSPLKGGLPGVNASIVINNSDENIEKAARRVMELSDVMRNWGNPAVREAHLAYEHRRNYGDK